MIEWMTMLGMSVAEGFAVELTRYALAAGGLAALLWLFARWVEARRIQLRVPNGADRRHEIAHSIQSIAVFALANVATILLVQVEVIHLSMDAPPLWLGLIQFAGIVIAHDAWFYWMHRALHHRRLFRRAHATHHMSHTPTPFAAYSFAPIEAVFESAFLPVFLLIVPFHMPVVLAFLLHQIIRNVLGHSGHEFAWPGFTRSRWTGWLTTTSHHDLHHSEGRYNFGLYFTWWDRWMSTEHPRYHQRFDAVLSREPVAVG